MRRLSPFLILTLLAACTIPSAQPDGAGQATVADAHPGHQPIGPDNAGRVEPDGAAPVADRGIGGTGATTAIAAAADRGIGGTGIGAGGTASGTVPSTQSVGSPNPLINSNTGTVTTAALVLNTSQPPGPRSARTRRRLGAVAVAGSKSAPPTSLLTGAVTSVTTTVSGSVPTATGSRAKTTPSASTGRAAAKAGTIPGATHTTE